MDGWEDTGTMSLSGGILGAGYGMGAFDKPNSKRYIEEIPPRGRKIIYTGIGGYDSQKEDANKILEVGSEYTVEEIYVGRSSSTVTLQEVSEKEFNTVMFIDKK